MNNYRKLVLKFLSCIAMFLLLCSCTVNYRVEQSEGISVTEDFAILETDGLILAFNPDVWIRKPDNLRDYFFPVLVSIRNQNKEQYTIKREDFSVLDDLRIQFDAVDLEEVILTLIDEEDEFVDKFTYPLFEERSKANEERIEARNNIMRESFHFGDILPQARKSGYIFFHRFGLNDEFSIVFKGKEIKYIKQN